MFFWEYSVSCNAGCHQARGVGKATDYETPWGTDVHAPFAGVASPFKTTEGGNGIRLVGKDYTFVGQHLAALPRAGHYDWRQHIADTGNTGTATTGPHIHAYIIINATGERVSFQYWLEDIIRKGVAAPAPAPTPQPVPAAGKKFTPPAGQAYWYFSAGDARAMRNVQGNGNGKDKRYSSQPMLIGEYDVIEDLGDVFAVRAKTTGNPLWVSGRLRRGIH
jgi:hypothetical protein